MRKKRKKNRISVSVSRIDDLSMLPKAVQHALADMLGAEEEDCCDDLVGKRKFLSEMVMRGDPGSGRLPDGYLLNHLGQEIEYLAHLHEHKCGSDEQVEVSQSLAGLLFQWVYDRGLIAAPVPQ